MQIAIKNFEKNIKKARHLADIYRGLKANTTAAIDLSDILRMELVLAVSALDHYIHEIVRLGILEAYRGRRRRTKSFLKFSVSLETLINSDRDLTTLDWLEAEIRLQFGHKSFQRAEKIAEAIRFISEVNLWNKLATQLGSTPENIKLRLNSIVERRNKIVHEADTSFIHEEWVEEAVNFIILIANKIHEIVTTNY